MVDVVVLEKNERKLAGGRYGCFDIEIDGVGTFRHERGPSLLLLRREYKGLFADCGVRSAASSSSSWIKFDSRMF